MVRMVLNDESEHPSRWAAIMSITGEIGCMAQTPNEWGAQYISIRYAERFAEAGIEHSVGSVGDSYDNALAETINGLLKGGVHPPRGPRRSLEAVEIATMTWLDWFHNRRMLKPIGKIPPAEAEERYYAMLDEPAIAA